MKIVKLDDYKFVTLSFDGELQLWDLTKDKDKECIRNIVLGQSISQCRLLQKLTNNTILVIQSFNNDFEDEVTTQISIFDFNRAPKKEKIYEQQLKNLYLNDYQLIDEGRYLIGTGKEKTISSLPYDSQLKKEKTEGGRSTNCVSIDYLNSKFNRPSK